MALVPVKEVQDVDRLGMAHGVCEMDSGTATEVLEVGKGVVADAAGEDVKLPASAAEAARTLGFVKYVASAPYTVDSDPPAYPVGEVVGLVKKGQITVFCDTAAIKGDSVFLVFGGAGVPGNVRNDDDGGNAFDLGIHARFNQTIAGPGLVRISVDLP